MSASTDALVAARQALVSGNSGDSEAALALIDSALAEADEEVVAGDGSENDEVAEADAEADAAADALVADAASSDVFAPPADDQS